MVHRLADNNPGHAIPQATVYKLWDASDKYSLLNQDRTNGSDRQGIYYWLHGDDAIAAKIKKHFDITE